MTHDQEEALTLSDRIAVMSGGDVLEIASPTALYERPTTRFVADFIGTMNFFDGRVRDRDGTGARVDSPVLGEVHTGDAGDRFAPGEPVLIAIRPEKMQLTFGRPGPGQNRVAGVLGPSAYLGDRSHFYVYLEGREEPVSVALQNLARNVERVGRNQQVCLSWADDAVVLLPGDREEGGG